MGEYGKDKGRREGGKEKEMEGWRQGRRNGVIEEEREESSGLCQNVKPSISLT